MLPYLNTFTGFLLVVWFDKHSLAWPLTQSNNVKQNDCTADNGLATCCSSLNSTDQLHRNRAAKTFHHKQNVECKIVKEYFPSHYEVLHQKMAEEINDNVVKLKEFLHSPEEIKRSLAWLERVKVRMSTTEEISETEDDRKYLSRFEVSNNCSGTIVSKWTEWIEPLILQTRHPFAYLDPVPAPGYHAGILNTDYVLLASHSHFAAQSSHETKSYFIDAGASEAFTISTQFFVCAYSQRGIHMDQIFSYEYIKHDPASWWATVPTQFINKVHFINVGVSADLKSSHNPIRLIKSLIKPHDFVAFKLDIDTSSIEIPILFQLLSDPKVYSAVDEFIFELHYSCPVMIKYWRHVKAPSGYEDKIMLNRVGALEIFSELRRKGIRSHFWI